jgi:hypothetical protein
MITVERPCWIVSRVHILTAGFISAGQPIAGMRRIFGRDIVFRIDVMVVKIERELEIIGQAVFEFLAKIDDDVTTAFLFPARGNPLLEFTMTLRREISSVSPCEDRFVRMCTGNAKQSATANAHLDFTATMHNIA